MRKSTLNHTGVSSFVSRLAVAPLVGFALALTGCQGDTDGGKAGDQTFEGTQFVPSAENSGSIRLVVNETEIQIGETSGFSVQVRDAAGSPVGLTRIACDSELGVAIIEPTTGFEITDSNGQISGVVGCAQPGSFLFGCRLPVGGNLRQFITIHCRGDVPAGFDGFAGASGGTLGSGGVDVQDDAGAGGTNTDGIRVTGVTLLDNPNGTSTGVQVDVVQGTCGTAPDLTAEPFTDTAVRFTVVNNTNSNIRFDSFTYSVPNATGANTGTFRSSTINFIGEATASAEGGEATLNALLFSATGPTAATNKYFVDNSGGTAIGLLGFRNVTFTIRGTTARGEAVSVTGTTAIAFSGYDRCS